MGLKFVLLVLLDLTALLFNSEMLWCCYRTKMMSKFLKKSRALCIIQGICQLTILATASVQAVMDCYIDDQRSNSCQILKLVLLSTMFLHVYNLMTILTMYFGRILPCDTRKQNTSFKLYATLSMGFIESVVLLCFNILPPMNYSEVSVKVLFVVTLMLFFITVSRNGPSDKSDQAEPLITKRRVFIVIGLLLCLFLVYRDESSSLLWDFEESEVAKEVLFIFTPKFIFGIILPVTFCDLIEFRAKEEITTKTFII